MWEGNPPSIDQRCKASYSRKPFPPLGPRNQNLEKESGGTLNRRCDLWLRDVASLWRRHREGTRRINTPVSFSCHLLALTIGWKARATHYTFHSEQPPGAQNRVEKAGDRCAGARRRYLVPYGSCRCFSVHLHVYESGDNMYFCFHCLFNAREIIEHASFSN